MASFTIEKNYFAAEMIVGSSSFAVSFAVDVAVAVEIYFVNQIIVL